MTKVAGSILSLVTPLLLAACAASPSPTVAIRTSRPAELPVYVDACPLSHLRGVHASVADVPGGVEIVFDGPDRVVDLVRGNVHAMAVAGENEGNPFVVCPCRDLGNDELLQAARPKGVMDLGATSMQPGSSMGAMPLAATTVSDTPTGAKLALTAPDEEEAVFLRSAARREVSAMGQCLSAAGNH